MDKEKDNEYAEKLLEDDKVLREAMVNGYMIVTGKLTYEDLINVDDKGGDGGLWLPTGFDETQSIDQLIEYFIETEEYERCAALVKLKKELSTNGNLDELTKIYNQTQWVTKQKRK